MSEIKQIEVLSDWLEYELETKLLNPPIVKLRIAPIYSVNAMDHVDEQGRVKSLTKMIVETVLEAIQAWDFTLNGEPVPVTDEMKKRCLMPLLGAKIKGQPNLLGLALFNHASNVDNFLKN